MKGNRHRQGKRRKEKGEKRKQFGKKEALSSLSSLFSPLSWENDHR
jgi:hypothetical protein